MIKHKLYEGAVVVEALEMISWWHGFAFLRLVLAIKKKTLKNEASVGSRNDYKVIYKCCYFWFIQLRLFIKWKAHGQTIVNTKLQNVWITQSHVGLQSCGGAAARQQKHWSKAADNPHIFLCYLHPPVQRFPTQTFALLSIKHSLLQL